MDNAKARDVMRKQIKDAEKREAKSLLHQQLGAALHALKLITERLSCVDVSTNTRQVRDAMINDISCDLKEIAAVISQASKDAPVVLG